MLKKIFIMTILFSMLTNLISFASNDFEKEKIDDVIKEITPYITNDDEFISRSNCISTIMKIVGVDEYSNYRYANAGYDEPVFADIDYAPNNGYIILAKFSDVAIGVSKNGERINYFEPDRNVTVKECLTYMLRCLKDPQTIEWDNILFDAEKFGLISKEDISYISSNEELLSSDFKKFLSRMLNNKRYLYWLINESQNGYMKAMRIDQTNSISYIDWFLELKNEQTN